MQLINSTILGIMILLSLGGLVVVKRWTTGSVLDKPKGDLLVKFFNCFNLCFLLAVNPLAAILFITHQEGIMDCTRIPIQTPLFLSAGETFGLAILVMGYGLMAWALIRLGDNYQLGGSAPRPKDVLVTNGPFRWLRHPMYTAALSISLGLACMIQSWVFFGVFCIYLALILRLIPLEEHGLRNTYGEPYAAYRQKTRRLIPFVY